MKKLLILISALMLAGIAPLTADAQDKNAPKKTRQELKAERNAREQLAFEKAEAAIDAREFVLEADQIVFKYHSPAYVTSNTNFVAVQGDKAVVQVAFTFAVGGPNGLGGVTVTGSVSDYKKVIDKKGNIQLSMNVVGVGISARVFIYVSKGNNVASADVSPNYNSRRTTLNGVLLPLDESNIFQGISL